MYHQHFQDVQIFMAGHDAQPKVRLLFGGGKTIACFCLSSTKYVSSYHMLLPAILKQNMCPNFEQLHCAYADGRGLLVRMFSCLLINCCHQFRMETCTVLFSIQSLQQRFMDSAEVANLFVEKFVGEECNAGMDKHNISTAPP